MEDIIDSATPLEMKWAGVHPRLFLTPARLAFLKTAIQTEPYARFLEQVRRFADARLEATPPDWTRGDTRGLGCVLPHMALLFLLTGETRYRDRALAIIRAAPVDKFPGLAGGHFLGGLAIAYDWLYTSLSPAEKTEIGDLLLKCGTYAFEQAGLFQRWTFIILICNHLPVEMSALTAAGCALYGERPHISRWLKLCVEKARVMVQANGADGASHEGIGYGQYYNEFFVKYLLLVKDLLGVDLFPESAYLKNIPLFYLHSSISREAWTAEHSLINFGDGVRYNWYGPDSHLRPLAAIYRDPLAQWLADRHLQAGTAAISGSFLNLTHYDPSVPAQFPATLPRSHHFDDKDFIFQRSGWENGEALLAFRCGPHFGHYALTRYTSEIGGGHMQANNGSVYLIAGGDYLVSGDGYFKKSTAYGNTLRFNHQGQIGEGGEWFESLALRRAQRGPRILARRLTGTFEYAIGDLAPAYPDELRIRRLTRKLLYLRPLTWILIDEFESAGALIPEARFHSDFPFEPDGESWRAEGKRFALRLTTRGTVDWIPQTSVQPCEYVNGTVTHRYPVLTLEAPKSNRAALITVLEVIPLGSQIPPPPAITLHNTRVDLSVTVNAARLDLRIRTLLPDPLAIGVEF